MKPTVASTILSMLCWTLRDALPNASFIGFTGPPIERPPNTRAVVWRLHQHLRHPASPSWMAPPCRSTMESRLAKLALMRRSAPGLTQVRRVTEGEEVERKGANSRASWAQPRKPFVARRPTACVSIAERLVNHFEKPAGCNERQTHDRVHLSRRIARISSTSWSLCRPRGPAIQTIDKG